MTIGIPDAITAQEVNDLTIVAACIRNGDQDITFKSMEFLAAPDSPMLQEDTITDVTVVHQLEARVFGTSFRSARPCVSCHPSGSFRGCPHPRAATGISC